MGTKVGTFRTPNSMVWTTFSKPSPHVRVSSWFKLGCSGHPAWWYKQLQDTQLVGINNKMSSSLSRSPPSMKSGVGVCEDWGSSWQELGYSGLKAPWYEQLLLSSNHSKMSSSLSRSPLSTKSGVGVFGDRGSSWQELWCSGHPAPWYKLLLTNTNLSKMSSSLSRCLMSTKSRVGVYEDRGSSWKESECPGNYSRWSDTFLLTKSASPVSRNLTMVDQLLVWRSLFLDFNMV